MTPKELGNRLKKARRAKKWRTRDLNRLTKINEDYIKDFEEGKFNFLPKPYIRAFLRTLSVTLGLDPEEILEDFEEIMNPPEVFGEKTPEEKIEKKLNAESKSSDRKSKKQEKNEEKSPVPEPEKPVPPKEEKKPSADKPTSVKKMKPEEKPFAGAQKPTRKTETTLVILVILLLLLAGYAYWKYGRQYFATKEEPVKEITVFEAKKEILKKEAAKKAAVKPVKTETPKPRPLRKVTLSLIARDTTWVRVIRDSADTSEYMFRPGNKRKFTADSLLQLKMGRADGLLLWVNGDSVGALGPASQVVSRLVIDRKGIREKKLRGPKPKPKPKLE